MQRTGKGRALPCLEIETLWRARGRLWGAHAVVSLRLMAWASLSPGPQMRGTEVTLNFGLNRAKGPPAGRIVHREEDACWGSCSPTLESKSRFKDGAPNFVVRRGVGHSPAGGN